jgi:hypothetical protein
MSRRPTDYQGAYPYGWCLNHGDTAACRLDEAPLGGVR